jgi:hypothetical protein
MLLTQGNLILIYRLESKWGENENQPSASSSWNGHESLDDNCSFSKNKGSCCCFRRSYYKECLICFTNYLFVIFFGL